MSTTTPPPLAPAPAAPTTGQEPDHSIRLHSAPHSVHKDGVLLQAKVFATPVQSFAASQQAQRAQQHQRHPPRALSAKTRFSSSATHQLQQAHAHAPFNSTSSGRTSPTQHEQHTLTGVSIPTPSQATRQLSASASPRAATAVWEHWAVGSPGTAASDAAREQAEVYSGAPRRGSPYSGIQYVSPRPSIPGAHARPGSAASRLAAGGVVRGRSYLGEAAGMPRPHSASSSARKSSNSPRSARGAAAFPPRKVITAELTALRQKYSDAAGASDQQQQHLRPHTAAAASDPRKMKQGLEALLEQLNGGDTSGVKSYEMGTGTTSVSHPEDGAAAASDVPGARIPAQLRVDTILKRQSQTAKMMRREDKHATAEGDNRIRNFRARALVHSASEMSRIKGAAELKEIQDKLVWARMRRDAMQSELYDLKDKLAHLP